VVNILQLAHADNGGATWWFKEAIERHTEHKVRAVRMVQNYLDYPCDLLGSSKEVLAELWGWADVIHIHDGAMHYMPPVEPKPTVITYHGNFYRRNHGVYHRRAKASKWVVTVSTLDLTTYHDDHPEWLPNPREDMGLLWNPHHRKFLIIHAPTNPATKSTAEVQEAVKGLIGVKLDLVQQVTYAQCIQRKARGHLLVDQFRYGYGNNAMEAWALGMPAIGGFWGSLWHRTILAYAGYLPFALAEGTVESIRETIIRLQDDPAFYCEIQDQGRQFFFAYHHAPVVARRAVEFYEQARDIAG
jgi:hypothetical protein